MRDPKLAHILVKVILPPNTAVSEYRRFFTSPVFKLFKFYLIYTFNYTIIYLNTFFNFNSFRDVHLMTKDKIYVCSKEGCPETFANRTSKGRHLRRVITVGTAYTAQYRPIPPNTAQYRPIPPNTAQYRPIPPNTAQYRQIPPNTAKYRQIPPNTAKYRQIPPNTAKYYVFGGIWRYIITSSVMILYNINITFIKNIGIL